MAANIALAHRRIAQAAQKRLAKTASIAAPIGGWNARDSLADMPPEDAVQLENWWPLPYDVMVREGYTQYTTGLPSQVNSLMVYSSPTTQKMFGASGTAFYNVGVGGAVGAPVVTGLTNSKWEYANISTAGGNFMLCVNGTDKLRGYDGTNWWVDGDGTHDITGFNTNTASTITIFKNRVWFTQNSSLKAWYLPTDAIAGAAVALDMQSICKRGGYLIAIGTWTIDAGYGVDDMLVCITNMGEVVVWRGTDPSNAVSWALAGVWSIGAPFNVRCMQKWAGDLLILTYDGLYPLSTALQSDRINPKVALTDKIYTAISQATSDYGSNFGWDIEYYAKANMLIINIPVFEGSQQQQFCMNTITKAWCNFTGINANSWAIFNDEPYFGSEGYVGKFWNTLSDNTANITGNAQQAFSYFGTRGQTKQWTMIRPTFRTNGVPTSLAVLNIDFSNNDAIGQLSYNRTTARTWDSAVWDTGIWGGGLEVSNQWQGIGGMGYCAGLRLKVTAYGIETHWVATDFVMKLGGIL